MNSFYHTFQKAPVIGGGYDSDAQAFFTANTGLGATIENAINDLVVGLKADGLWSKFYAIYPMVGGTASSHKWNLKDPRDLDAAFRLVFSGTITHDANGVTGNGTNGYADTKFNDTTVGVSSSDFSMGMSSRTNSSLGGCDMGAIKNPPASYNMLWVRRDTSLLYDNVMLYDDSNFYGNYVTNSTGLFTINRTSSTEQKFYQGATLKATRSGFSATTGVNYNHYLMCRNVIGSPGNYSNRNYNFFFFATAFDATQMTNLNSRHSTFQTALSR
jgi:hypothetical protein